MYVAGQMGLIVKKCSLITLDRSYIRKGEINPKQMFVITDVTTAIQHFLANVPEQLESACLVMRRTCPKIDIGLQCYDPDPCPLIDDCWTRITAVSNNVFSLYRLRFTKAMEWYRAGILACKDIPADTKLSNNQRIQIQAEKTGKAHVDKPEIRKFLSQLKYPLYFLDFETCNPAIPRFDNSSPYAVLPFQYSLHVVTDLKKAPAHYSWLWDGLKPDPRGRMLKELKARIGNKGTILAYNAPYEKRVLREAGEVFKKYRAWVKQLDTRFLDLLSPFRSFHYYHPFQRGSASIKMVLPALTGKGYDGLEISGGNQASAEFMRVFINDNEADRREAVRKELEEYCGLDTGGMFDIVRKLGEMVG